MPQDDFDRFISVFQGSELTKKLYSESLATFRKFLGNAEPTQQSVESFVMVLEKRDLSSASVNRHLSAVRAYFRWKKRMAPPEKKGLWDIDVSGPKIHNKLPRITHQSEITKLLTFCTTAFDEALIRVTYDAALRAIEVRGLDIRDIDFQDALIKITGKGGDESRLPIGQETLAALRRQIGSRRSGPVFDVAPWRISAAITRLTHAAGLKGLTPHQLRHARAQELRRQDVAREDIQMFLRHKDPKTTDRYARLEPTELQRKIPNAF